ncbi:MAG: hypothetical protein AB7O73_01595 [Bacteroidia bacterium]
MKKGLEEYKQDAYELAKKTSEISRQLAFAGIAIIWIYRNPDPNPILLQGGLLLPLFLWILCLSIDLVHHFFGALAWYIFFQIKQHQFNAGALKKTDDVGGPFWVDYFATALFIIKVTLNIWAYIELGKFFLPKLGLV